MADYTQHSVEDRLTLLEHYVHGRGWRLRVLAWVGMAALVGFVMWQQSQAVNQALTDRRSSCEASLVALNAIQAAERSGIRPETSTATIQALPPSLQASAFQQQAATIRENASRRAVIKVTEHEEETFRASAFCDGVNVPRDVQLPTQETLP